MLLSLFLSLTLSRFLERTLSRLSRFAPLALRASPLLIPRSRWRNARVVTPRDARLNGRLRHARKSVGARERKTISECTVDSREWRRESDRLPYEVHPPSTGSSCSFCSSWPSLSPLYSQRTETARAHPRARVTVCVTRERARPSCVTWAEREGARGCPRVAGWAVQSARRVTNQGFGETQSTRRDSFRANPATLRIPLNVGAIGKQR